MNRANKTARNRLHSATRWPSNLPARLDLAWTDWQYVRAMRQLGFDAIDLRRIEEAARRVLDEGECK